MVILRNPYSVILMNITTKNLNDLCLFERQRRISSHSDEEHKRFFASLETTENTLEMTQNILKTTNT